MTIPFWLLVALGIIINLMAAYAVYYIYSLYQLINRYNGTINIGWGFLVIWALFILFWCYYFFH